MPATPIDVSILFANWNGRDILRDAIRSVREKTRGLTFEIIVVDDCSTDDSVDMLRREFPDVKLIANERNLQFAKSNNIGVRHAKGQYVFLLNTDTQLFNNAVKVCMDFLTQHPEAGVCGCWLKGPDGSSQVSFGSFPSFGQALVDAFFLNDLFPKAHLPSRGAIPDESIGGPMEVDYVTGAAIMIRKEVIDEIGLFDELYIAYTEETDFCYRVRHVLNKKVYFLPQAEIMHLGGMSYRAAPEYQVRLMYAGYDKFLKKYHGSTYSFSTRMLYAWSYFFKMSVRFFRYLFTPRDERQRKKRELLSAWYAVRYSLLPDRGVID